MKPGAWESGKGNHLCPESMENLPGTEAEDFRIPESLMKESYIFKKLFKGLALFRGHRGGGSLHVKPQRQQGQSWGLSFPSHAPQHPNKEELSLCADQNLNSLSWFIHSIKCTVHLLYPRHCATSRGYNSEPYWQKYLSPWNLHSIPPQRMKPFKRQWEMQTVWGKIT